MRTFDLELVKSATDPYRDETVGFNPQKWLESPQNVALTNNNGDIALFERELPGIVTGHYFFHSRGKEALKAAKQMLEEAFTGDYDIKVIRGLTPLDKLGALWMNKKLGFKSYGKVETLAGPCELVILTKKEWETMNG